MKYLGRMSVTWITFFTKWLIVYSGTLFQTGAMYLLCINNFIFGANCLLLVWNILHWGHCSRCCQTVGSQTTVHRALMIIFRPRFLTKSRLAFTIFNSLLLGLLLIHFAASHFYEPISDQPPNMVFPALFATGTPVVYIVRLQVPMKMGRFGLVVKFRSSRAHHNLCTNRLRVT